MSSFSTASTLTEWLVKLGAPSLPAGYQYRLEIQHPTLVDGGPTPPANVTARIGYAVGDEWVEVSRYTEVTRVDLGMASVAACRHSYEIGYERGRL